MALTTNVGRAVVKHVGRPRGVLPNRSKPSDGSVPGLPFHFSCDCFFDVFKRQVVFFCPSTCDGSCRLLSVARVHVRLSGLAPVPCQVLRLFISICVMRADGARHFSARHSSRLHLGWWEGRRHAPWNHQPHSRRRPRRFVLRCGGSWEPLVWLSKLLLSVGW